MTALASGRPAGRLSIGVSWAGWSRTRAVQCSPFMCMRGGLPTHHKCGLPLPRSLLTLSRFTYHSPSPLRDEAVPSAAVFLFLPYLQLMLTALVGQTRSCFQASQPNFRTQTTWCVVSRREPLPSSRGTVKQAPSYTAKFCWTARSRDLSPHDCYVNLHRPS